MGEKTINLWKSFVYQQEIVMQANRNCYISWLINNIMPDRIDGKEKQKRYAFKKGYNN